MQVAVVGSQNSDESQRFVLRADVPWNAVKVFTAVLREGDNRIGDAVTAWLAENDVLLAEVVIAQSTSAPAGCISIALFYRRREPET